MNRIFTNSLLFSFCLLLSFSITAQESFWKDVDLSNKRIEKKDRISTPSTYRTLSLDIDNFLNIAEKTTPRFKNIETGRTANVKFSVPLPDGSYEEFILEESELMHPDLAAKFPELKSYVGKGVKDKTANLRVTYSPYFGFSGMIMSGKHSTVYIDPISKDNEFYMTYYRSELTEPELDFQCFTEENLIDKPSQTERSVPATGDCNLRRYRLALSCTGEYAQYHIGQAGGTTGTTAGDKAIVQAAMNVTMNRVNGVYEIDLGITMQVVANNDLVIYLDGNSDPWTNEYNTTTAQTCDAQIGVNNYDIGHNFNTTGGGSAGCIDCVCLNVSQNGTHKGRGYTGRAAPIGDPFDIDYVAHEMGHQFGGYHTQSNSSCRSGSGNTEVETGSGSSIMGYAGICNANVQNNSDDYFAYVNIRDIVTSINSGNGSGCAEVITSGNSGPTADAGSDYSIPKSTPFKLTGVGTDADDTGLTYCWEQNDPENPGSNAAPSPTRTVGPMFRTLSPVAVPYRYFPNLPDLINNVSPTWEVLPSIGRSMDFSFLVRDNNSASGCTASDLMTVTTINAAGPFITNAPNGGEVWDVGTTENVTWNVAGTTAAPINCANVDILLSTDGGNTYPITLAASVPNDGTHPVTVPNNIGTTNRVMVVCSDNIFFDISNNDFAIEASGPKANVSFSSSTNIDEGTACTIKSVTFDISISQSPSANADVTWSFSGTAINGADYSVTGGTSHTFTTANWSTPHSVTLDIEQDGVVEADETIIVTITSANGGGSLVGSSNQLTFTLVNDDNAPASGASGDFTLGAGGTSAETFYSPFRGYYEDERMQLIYPASELLAMGATAGDITAIAFNIITKQSTQPYSSFNINMGTTTDVAFPGASYYTGLSNVYTSTVTTVTGWNTFTLGTPFTWDGTSSIIVEVCWDNNSWTDSDIVGYDDVGYDAVSYNRADGASGCTLGTQYLTGNRAQTRFSIVGSTGIQTVVNTSAGFAEHNLGPNQTVHFYDQATGNIMVTIQELSGHDYGCTKVEVDRQGIDDTGWILGYNVTNKTFKVTPTNNNPTGSYSITLYYEASELPAFLPSITSMVKGAIEINNATNNASNSFAEADGQAAFGTDYQFTATFNSGFSGFALSDAPPVPFPVELSYFKASKERKDVRLHWETASELNNKGFHIEYGTDGRHFERIGWVNGKGTTSSITRYEFLHEAPRGRYNYYRLAQEDFDGTTEYTDVEVVEFARAFDIQVFPNPSTDGSTTILQLETKTRQEVNINIFDSAGKKVMSLNQSLDKGVNTINLSKQQLSKGIYFISISHQAGTENIKLSII